MSISLFGVCAFAAIASPNVTVFIVMRFIICMVGAGIEMAPFVFGKEIHICCVLISEVFLFYKKKKKKKKKIITWQFVFPYFDAEF